jgi:hypothetical protein
MMHGNEFYVSLAHGVDAITLEDEKHYVHGVVGFFLGNRIVVPMENEIHQQDPPLWGCFDFETLTDFYRGRIATAADCGHAAANNDYETEDLLSRSAKGAMVETPKLFPIPIEWWHFFLSGSNRTARETYHWVSHMTKYWKSTSLKVAASMAKYWCGAASTKGDEDT